MSVPKRTRSGPKKSIAQREPADVGEGVDLHEKPV
jgi:hypothetical protein